MKTPSRIMALVMVTSAVLILAPVVRAEPVNGAAIDVTRIGLAEKVELRGTDEPSELEIPVPAGAGLATFSGTVGSVVNVANGRVDVLDGAGNALGAIPTPATPGSAPFSVDVAAAQITDGAARLRLQLRDDRGDGPAANACSTTPTLTLNNMTIAYLGDSPNPTTVADFLPRFLARVVIRVGASPDAEIQQAALQLVSRLTALYNPMPIRIDVDDAAGPPTPQSADTRVVEIDKQPQASVSVRDGGAPTATLVIAGTGAALANQIELFADRRVELVQTPSATVASATASVAKATRVMTFRQLGMTSQASVLGTSTLYTGFDAAAFDVGPVEAADIHLIANYTPVGGGEGSVLIRAGSTVLASHALDNSGRLDTNITVPADAITSKTGLALDIRYTPRQECAPLSDRMTFALDPSSTISVTPGIRNRGGFPALPMSLTPEFDVAISSPNLLKYAAEAVNLMGQQSQAALHPVVRPFDEAVASTSPLVIVSDEAKLAGADLGAPLQPGADNSLTVNAAPVTSIDVKGPLGAIQAFTSKGRAVLAISGDDWALVDQIFDHVWQLENRWSSLSGDVLATGAQNTTVNLTIREGGSIAPLPVPSAGWRWWTWATVGIAIAAAVAVGLILLARRRRRGRIE